MTTEGITKFPQANSGTPPTSRAQMQNANLCLSGLCSPVAPVPTQLIRTGSGGPGGTGVIATGGIGVYVKPAGTAVTVSALTPESTLPAYRPGGR
jgi:hypothetical protein